MLMRRNTLLGFGAGVLATLFLVESPFGGHSPPGQAATPPDVIGGMRSAGASIDPIDVDLGAWQGWFVHTKNGYRQVAFSMPGQPGVLVGELYDDAGEKMGQQAVFSEERARTSIGDVERLSSWVSRDFVDPPGVANVQARDARIHPDGAVEAPQYLLVDPFSEEARDMAGRIQELIADGVRVIPVSAPGSHSFDGLHAVMEGSTSDSGESSLSTFLAALNGDSVSLQSDPDDPRHEQAFIAFSKNISLQSALGAELLPAIIRGAAEGGIKVTPLSRKDASQQTG